MDHPGLVHGAHALQRLLHVQLDAVEVATRKVLITDNVREVAVRKWHHRQEAVRAYRYMLIITAGGEHLIIDVSSS